MRSRALHRGLMAHRSVCLHGHGGGRGQEKRYKQNNELHQEAILASLWSAVTCHRFTSGQRGGRPPHSRSGSDAVNLDRF